MIVTVTGVVLMVFGVLFLLIAAVGLLRLPDALQRMHSATKAGTLGTALVITGAMMAGDLGFSTSGFLTIVFLLITLPFSAQLLSRAAYIARTPLEGIAQDPLDEADEVTRDAPKT